MPDESTVGGERTRLMARIRPSRACPRCVSDRSRRGATSVALTVSLRLGFRMGRSVALEVLHLAFVLLGGLARLEGAEVPPLPGLRILLPGVESIPPGLELLDHVETSFRVIRTAICSNAGATGGSVVSSHSLAS